MIDIENHIYTEIANTLEAKYPGIRVENQPTYESATFPVVSVMQLNNLTLLTSSGNKEVANQVSFEFKVYSNKLDGAKDEAKDIALDIDNIMTSLGFAREQFTQVPNYMDTRIYQFVLRYSTVVDTSLKTYRR